MRRDYFFSMAYISFYLFLETACIAGFSWMKYGTEHILFLTKLWYKLAQFSILLLTNLTGAQFVKQTPLGLNV